MSSLSEGMQQQEQDLPRRPATLQEVLPGAQPMVTPPVEQVPFSPEDDGCVSCGAPVVPGTAGCKDCNEHALEAVGAPRCLTEKQVFVMGYLAVRAHSFRTHEGFIDSEVMAAIHRDAERLWDMLQKGLEKG